MKFKVGQIVRIKNNDGIMDEFRGQCAEITKVGSTRHDDYPIEVHVKDNKGLVDHPNMLAQEEQLEDL